VSFDGWLLESFRGVDFANGSNYLVKCVTKKPNAKVNFHICQLKELCG